MKYSASLWALERATRKLLARVGKFSESYDSARVCAALGYLSQAAAELKQAAQVREASERRDQ